MDGDVREIVSAISMDVMKYTKKWKGAGGGVARDKKLAPGGDKKAADHYKEWGPKRGKAPAFKLFPSWLTPHIKKHRDRR